METRWNDAGWSVSGFAGQVWVLSLVAGVCALVMVHLLAVRRTAGTSLAGAVVLTLAVTAIPAVRGEPPHYVAGAALTAGGVVAVVWATGRSRRHRSARRSALADYEAGTAAVPLFAALAERDRLAAELHDVAAHRLTGIVVAAGAALRLADRERAGDALRHADEAGREAVGELERLTGLDATAAGFTEVDALAAAHAVDYRRTVDTAPAASTEAAYRVVREALTNAARYAEGATVRVRIEPTDDEDKPEQGGGERLFTVTVTDDGGTAVEPGLGTGRGLAGLAAVVTARGGRFHAGPHGEGAGWRVRASLPAATVPPLRRWPLWRGTVALDYALVALAIALSLGASLMTAEAPFGGLLPALVTVVLSGLHAVPLAWRSRAPGRALAAVLSALLLWWACDRTGWTQPPVSDIFLVYGWVELTLVHSVGVRLPWRRGLFAPLAVAAVGGLALTSGGGITGSRTGAWAVLAGVLALPALAVWSWGRRTARRHERLRAADARRRVLLDGDADAAVSAQRLLFATGLRDTALRHARAVVAAAEDGDLRGVREEARAGLTALRDLLAGLRAGAAGFLLKDAEPERVIDAVRVVHGGAALLDPAVTRRLFDRFTDGPGPLDAARLGLLTPRETEVLRQVARGLSNAEIAAVLGVSAPTVKDHVSVLLGKLGVRDRVQATIAAYETGLIRPGSGP
ncbi:hybrid sensor histidine kinase/response regulator transcription factor [Streptomyces sp. AK08-02]|uniref:hybrid sensor histidine kinase/response regulator transcription factor n=1 Tax=Streptomyces sp. AK08-02 TaxID=3028654 RepID=UPI0039F57B92